MATSDRDRNGSRLADGQLDFSGGMDWISDASKVPANMFRLGQNIDIRTGNAEKAKGQQPAAPIEIGAFYYDRFNSANLESSKWAGITSGDSIIAVNSSNQLSLTGVTSGHAWDSMGVIAQRQTGKATGSYIELELTTPTSPDSNSRFRIGLSSSNSALGTDSGLEIEFDESLNIIKRESASETDTTINWVAATKYRIRIEKQATGWLGYLVDLTNAEHTAVALFDTSFTGNADNFLELQAYGSEWITDTVVYHDGFGSVGARQASQGIYRYYKETDANEAIVCNYGTAYKFDDSDGYTAIGSGFDTQARFKYRVFNDELYLVNGVDQPRVYNSINMQTLGSGSTAAPIAEHIEVHLQSIFMAQTNSLYRNVVGNTRSWEPLEPLVDVDAWNGDTIKGLVKLGSNLYIVKSASVWELVGTTNNNFVLRRILGSRGCVAPHSIATNGQVAFWRGPEGVYRFDGTTTSLVSFRIHQAFDNTLRSEFPQTLSSRAGESVGVIHNFKYRLSVVQYGEEDLSYNNYEYVFDMLANGQQGGWITRTNRNVSMYSAWDGDGDNNELYYVSSDTSNDTFVAEVDNGNYRNDYSNISLVKKSDVDFPGRIVSRKYNASSTSRVFLDKKWQDMVVLYEPRSKVRLGFTTYTKYNTGGTLDVFTTTSTAQDVVAIVADGGEDSNSGDPFVEEKEDFRLDATKNKNQGTEFWWEITQDSTVRAFTDTNRSITAITGTGLLTNPGNFEPFSIKKVICRFSEANH